MQGKIWRIVICSLVTFFTVFWVGVLSARALSFAPAVNYGVGNPWSVAVGDFNGDGRPDLATANYGGNSVSILLGDGSGGFAAAVNYSAGTNPASVAVGDFDRDGNLDLAVANNTVSGTVSILLGNGDGIFTAASGSPVAVGTYPVSVAVGDFNGDGNPDLAVANYGDNNVSILLGLGDGLGGFAAAVNYSVGTHPRSVVVGDFNRDGKPDLAVANSSGNNVSILLGDGLGGFSAASGSPFAVGSYPASVAVGDFNGDGKLDLATANNGSANVSILLGNGTGGFAAAVNYSVSSFAWSVAVGDFNGDGKPDLATANDGGNNASILLGNGDGTFAAAVNFGTGSGSYSVAAGDFNGDGKPDLAVANQGSGNVSILLNTSAFELAGAFAPAVNYPVGNGPESVAAGDFNRDGIPDLAVANYVDNNVSILLGNGDGTFQTAVNYTTGTYPWSVAVGDFNGDGKPDLAVANFSSATVSILLGNGTGTFASKVDYGTGTHPTSVAVSDFNGDGKPDLAVANKNFSGTVSILLGNGNGTFQTKVDYGVGNWSQFVAVGDFNRDGKPDLVTANESSDNVSILLGNGTGTFGAATNYGTGTSTIPYSVAVGDFNGDGKPDLATANNSGSNVSILLGDGLGAFAAAVNYGVGANPDSVAVGDFNGDGKLDLATANYSGNSVSILLGNGNGTFQTNVDYGVGAHPTLIVAGDFDGDGKPDLAVTNENSGNVSVLLNQPFLINEGEAYITSPAVTLHYYPTGDHKYIRTSTGIANPTTGAFWSAWKALPVLPSHTLNLGTTQGYRNVFAQVKNAVGDISPVSRALTFLDTAAPTAVVKINGGAASVLNTGGSTTVRLHMAFFDRNSSGWDGAQMRYSTTAFAVNDPSPVWGPYVTGQDVVLSGTGLKKIYVQFMDGAGRKSAVYAPSITVSNTGPAWTPSTITDSGSFMFGGGATLTTTTSVSCTYTLTSVPPANIKVRYCFLNSTGVIAWTAWETPTSTSGTYDYLRNLTLAGGNGLRQVYLQIKDLSDISIPNRITDPFMASIILDTTVPSANVQINNGAASVKKGGDTTTVTLTIVANDAGSDVREMEINQTGVSAGAFGPFASTVSFNLDTSTTGTKYVYLWVKDNAGRVSTRKSDSINVLP